MNSAYMLDHLYYLSLFKDFQGFHSGKPHLTSNASTAVSDLQPLILSDLKALLTPPKHLLLSTTSTCSPKQKTILIESLLRYFDFVNEIENQTTSTKTKQKYLKSDQKLVENISLAK